MSTKPKQKRLSHVDVLTIGTAIKERCQIVSEGICEYKDPKDNDSVLAAEFGVSDDQINRLRTALMGRLYRSRPKGAPTREEFEELKRQVAYLQRTIDNLPRV